MIRQNIVYKAPYSYWGGFLQNILKYAQLEGSVEAFSGRFELSVSDHDAGALERFGKACERYLPHSLFVGEITTAHTDEPLRHVQYHSAHYPLGLCPRCVERIVDPASPEYLSDTLVCDHYGAPSQGPLEDGHLYTPHYSMDATLLLVDAHHLGELFTVTESEIKALFSIEKPRLKLTIKDETLKHITHKHFLYVQAPWSLKSHLIALNARESGVPYLWFHARATLDVLVVHERVNLIRDTRGLFPVPTPIYATTMLNRAYAITHEAGYSDAIVAYLSHRMGIHFIHVTPDGARIKLRFQEFDPHVVRATLQETHAPLLVRYEEHFGPLSWEGSWWEMMAALLGLSSRSFESLSDHALEFRGNGGLKLETLFGEEGFSYATFFQGMMSFRLGGTPTPYLAYSIFEALGDMCISVVSQLKTRLGSEHTVMMGDLMGNSIVYSRLVSKFSFANPYFATAIALDE